MGLIPPPLNIVLKKCIIGKGRLPLPGWVEQGPPHQPTVPRVKGEESGEQLWVKGQHIRCSFSLLFCCLIPANGRNIWSPSPRLCHIHQLHR